MQRQEFIAIVAPVIVKVRIDGGVLFPSVSLAQTILETGGEIPPWNNIVGYKVGSGRQTEYWHGKTVNRQTWEVIDGVRYDNVPGEWRAYDSIEDSLKDQALLFINNASRYQRVIDARTPAEQAAMLKACGYATDPAYAQKITSLIRSGGFEIYDKEAEEGMEAIRQMQQQLEAMKKENEGLRSQIAVLQQAVEDQAPPEWAAATIEKLTKLPAKTGSGVILTDPKGDRSFHRTLVVMDRAGVFDE